MPMPPSRGPHAAARLPPGRSPSPGSMPLRTEPGRPGFVCRNMRTLYLAAILPLAAGATAGEGRVTWQHEGYGKLFDAATAARKSGRRILVGVPGAGT